MDSDLAESVSALQAVFVQRAIKAELAPGDRTLVTAVSKALSLPYRYRSFLLEANPVHVETVSPVERVRFVPVSELLEEQRGFATAPKHGWRKSWAIFARSTLLGDPYFFDTAKVDAEDDCAVYTAMSGTDRWEPRLCASSFERFLRILAASMHVAQGFGEAALDVDDEASFREALGARIKTIDAAALRAGHWTLHAAR